MAYGCMHDVFGPSLTGSEFAGKVTGRPADFCKAMYCNSVCVVTILIASHTVQMLLANGGPRTRAQMERLFAGAGFGLARIVRTRGLLCVVGALLT